LIPRILALCRFTPVLCSPGAQDIAVGKRMMVSLVSIGAGLDTIGLAGANTLHWRVPQSIAQAGTQSSCSDAIS
jgi:hypothetical protein